METSFVSLAQAQAAASAQEAGGVRTANPAEATVAKDMFLRLLVTQIKHQNPLNPADGIEFLAQLAQFTGLEQMIAMRQELETIREAITGQAAAAPSGQKQS